MPLLKGSGAGHRDIAIGFIRQGILKTVFPCHRSPRFIAGFCDVQIDKSRGGVGVRAAGDDGRAVSADISADINRRAVILGFRIICRCFRGCAGWQIDDGQRQQKSHDACGFHTVHSSFVLNRSGGVRPKMGVPHCAYATASISQSALRQYHHGRAGGEDQSRHFIYLTIRVDVPQVRWEYRRVTRYTSFRIMCIFLFATISQDPFICKKYL